MWIERQPGTRLTYVISSGCMQARKSSFVRGLAILTSASLLQNLITFGSAPILARLFSPEQFGIAGLIQSLFTIIVPLVTGQYFLALGIARNRSESINIAFLSMLLAPILAALALPVTFYLQANPQLLPRSLVEVAPYLWTIPAFMVVGGVLFVTRLWEIRHAHYGSQVLNRLIESAGIAAAQIGFGLVGAGSLGLIMGRWLGTTAASAHGFALLLRQIGRVGLRAISIRRMRMLAIRHWRFPAYQLPAQMLSKLTLQLTPLLLAFFYSLEAIGFFWFANRLLERPAMVLGENVGRVFYQHAADLRKEDRPVSQLFRRSTAMLAAVAIIPFSLVILFAPPLFALVFGTEWEMAGHYARWIATANFVMLIAIPARSVTVLFELQRTFVVFEAFRAVASVSALILAARFGASELFAVAAASIVQSLTLLAFVAVIGVSLFRLDRRIGPQRSSR